MKLILNKKINKQKGFTLMESMVAIFILMLAITGPMVFAQNGLRAAFLSRDQITAFFLAQDAIEYVKNVRDGNVIDIVKSSTAPIDGWLGLSNSPLNNLCVSSDGLKSCSIDTLSGNIASCSSNSVTGCIDDADTKTYTPLNYFNNGSQSYFTAQNANGGNIKPSLFAREVTIKKINHNGNLNIEAEITVKIRWKSHEGVGVREIVVKENIFNWANALIN